MRIAKTVSSVANALLVASVVTLSQTQAVTISHGGDSVDMDFVDIGNAGNVADGTGDGAVSYDYSIGQFEVTAAQWAAVSSFDVNVEDTANDPYGGSQPTANASWYEAAKFANWLTSGDALQGAYQFSDATTFTGVDRNAALSTYGTVYVLPTEDEWYKAAYFKSDGSGYTLYPTGDTVPLVGTEANYNDVNDGPWNVGSGIAGNNGAFDMAGNVLEWTESAFDGDPNFRVLRGGDWDDISNALQSSTISLNFPANEGNNVGFRIASLSVVPEPSSGGLLLIGAMSALVQRKRG